MIGNNMKLGVFIGSFNPPHKGHIHVVNYLLDEKIVDKVLIIPTMNYWDKQDLVDIRDRINMLKIYENKNIIIDTVNNNYPYTFELMRKLKNDYPYEELYLIIGADNIINFDKWKNYEELLKYNIIIMNRNDIDINKYIKKYQKAHFIVLKNFHEINISSTEIRNKINKELLDVEVLNYINKHHLYLDKKNKVC